MDILTRDFGSISVNPSDVIQFVSPIFGFDDYQKYVMLCDDEIGSHFAWLQSIDDPNLCFLLADPGLVHPSYKETIPETAFQSLGNEASCECWVMMVVPKNFAEATVNLKSPILINTETHQAAQVILELDYPIRCPLMERKDEQLSC